jgi:hypothetical protein
MQSFARPFLPKKLGVEQVEQLEHTFYNNPKIRLYNAYIPILYRLILIIFIFFVPVVPLVPLKLYRYIYSLFTYKVIGILNYLICF